MPGRDLGSDRASRGHRGSPFGVPASDCVVLYHTLLLGVGNGIKTFDGMAFFPGSVQVTEDRRTTPLGAAQNTSRRLGRT